MMVYLVLSLVLVALGYFLTKAYRSSNEAAEVARVQMEAQAERRRNFKRTMYPMLTTAPLPACRNDSPVPLQLPLTIELVSYLDALTTWEVFVDGELYQDGVQSDIRNGSAIRFPTLVELEKLAKKHAHQQWLVKLTEPLQSFIYQRHGPDQWNLIRVGTGMF